MDGGGKATRQNRYSRTGDRECQLPVVQAGIPSGGLRGATMKSGLIFPRFAESTTLKNLFESLLLLIAGAPPEKAGPVVRGDSWQKSVTAGRKLIDSSGCSDIFK